MGPGLPGESRGQFLRRHGERTEVVRDKGFVDKELPMSIRSRKLASAPVLGPPHHTTLFITLRLLPRPTKLLYLWNVE